MRFRIPNSGQSNIMSATQTRTDSRFQIDMCHGPLFGKIVLFSLPLIFTYILQMLFNAADLIVIGQFSSHESMAAIGCTINLNSLVINLFIGLSIGANVIAAKAFGAKDPLQMRNAVQTAMTLALYGGILLMIAALAAAEPLLVMMDTPPEILPPACKYVRICFASIPFIMIYNFGCAILRAVGDTRRPLYYLIIAGILNVGLNVFFVVCCGMDVAGVALATTASHILSAVLITNTLLKTQDSYKLDWKKLRLHRSAFKEILKIGIPAGLQSSCYAVSNMLIQSSINSFGSHAIAGQTAALQLEGIVYVASYAYHQTAISFVAQNLGGHKFKRILKSLYGCFSCSAAGCLLLGWGFYCFGETLLAVFNPDPEVIRWGLIRMQYLFTIYFICGIMDTATGALRGLGHSLLSAVICLLGVCGLRIAWVKFVFPHDPEMGTLLLSYPVSWALVATAACVALAVVYRKLLNEQVPRLVGWSKLGYGVMRGMRFVGSPK